MTYSFNLKVQSNLKSAEVTCILSCGNIYINFIGSKGGTMAQRCGDDVTLNLESNPWQHVVIELNYSKNNKRT